MPQEPKKRHSRQRKGKRRNSISLKFPKGVACLNCGYTITAHTVCKKCGFYKGAKILTVKSDKVKKES
ncbi:50S ribosomal protein L32 [Patescibacteria group bacterium]|nr:50S ribosomal protein L32 [Patescibacteria group bacterium]